MAHPALHRRTPPEATGSLQRKLDHELDAMRKDLSLPARHWPRLGITRDEAKETWKLKRWRRPPRLLDDFHPKAEAPQTLLPSPRPAPMVLEAYER